MEQPQGRTIDVLHLPSGTALAHRLTAIFSNHPESVRLFQIHQHADFSLTVRVVEGTEPDAKGHIERAVDEPSGQMFVATAKTARSRRHMGQVDAAGVLIHD